MSQFILYISNIILLLTFLIILFIIFGLCGLKFFDLILKKYKLILICDIEDYPFKLYKFIKFFNMNIFDINDDVSIINYFIENPETEILLDTNGGYISSNDKIVNFIIDSKIKLKIYVMRKAYSAGTILALSAENLYMDNNACLGPTDPQITILKDTISIKSLIKMYQEKDKNYISDIYLINYYEYKRSHDENIKLITKLLNKKFYSNISKKDQNILIDKFTSGDTSHHIPISFRMLNEYIKINNDIPYYIENIYYSFCTLFRFFN